MISNKKIVNYKLVDLAEIYNFSMKFINIQLVWRSYQFYSVVVVFKGMPHS